MSTRRKKSIKANETGVTNVGRPLLQYNVKDAVRLVRFFILIASHKVHIVECKISVQKRRFSWFQKYDPTCDLY
jgi:hypothetical protein